MLKRCIGSCLVAMLFLFFGNLSPAYGGVNLDLKAGWNLLGPRVPVLIQESPLANSPNIVSIWKWADGEKGKGWAVYLPNYPDKGASYAETKGFYKLSSLEADDGFWINSEAQFTLTIPGNQVVLTKLELQYGWNLKGLTCQDPIDVASVFQEGEKFLSVWVWDTSAKDPTWAVYLPGKDTASYANPKGFKVLQKIEPGQGFWVNVKAVGATTVQLVETPPLVGKVSELLPFGDKGSYKPVADALVSVDGKEVGKTDSQGKFQVPNFTGTTAKVEVSKEGYIQYKETISVPESKQIYVFIQKQDPVKNSLEGAEGGQASLGKVFSGLSTLGYMPKPVPKILKSKEDEAIVTITNMKLQKDITVAVTPFKALNVIPGLDEIAKLDLGGEAVPVGGASVEMVDSKGKPITNEEAGFQGVITVSTKKILGKYSVEDIKEKLNKKEGTLVLVAKGNEGWYKVPGEGVVEKEYIRSGEGSPLNQLHTFVFLLASKKSAGQLNLKGKVTDKDSGNGIPGAYVMVDGFSEYAITDDKGNFDFKITLLDQGQGDLNYFTILTWVDGYYGETKTVTKNEVSNPITISLKSFGQVLKIEGKIKDSDTNDPILDAKVILKAPSVLDQIKVAKDGVTVRKDENALYEWRIYDSNYQNVLKTIKGKGKNTLFLSEIENLANLESEQFAILFIELVVQFGDSESNSYSEMGAGYAMFFKQGENLVDLFPGFSTAPYYEVYSDQSGSFSFYMIPKSVLSFLQISASKQGYYSSPFEKISGTGSVILKEISLKPKPTSVDIKEGFEGPLTGWTSKVLVEGAEVANSDTKWQVVENPESVQVNNKVMEYFSQGIEEWEDTEGTVTDITLNNDLSYPDWYKVYNAILTYTVNGQPKSLTVFLYDIDETVPGYDFFTLGDFTGTDIYIWWDFGKYAVTENYTYPIQNGSVIMVSYKKPKEKKIITLPPPFSGSKVYWFGNMNNGSFKGTYYDSVYSNKNLEGVTVSPVYDLTNFDSPVLTFNTWFEVSSTKTASLVVEIAIVDDTLKEGDAVTIESIYGSTKLKKGEFVPLAQVNPMLLYGFDFSSFYGGDEDEDGIPDMLELGGLDPDSDLDGDGLTNLAEWVAGILPGTETKTVYMPPMSTSFGFGSEDPTLLEWVPMEYNLQPFGGHKIQLRFRFIHKNLPGSLYRGWAIDDVSIKDVESYYPFQLLTKDFGYGDVVNIPEGPKPVLWEGSYNYFIENVTVTDLDTLDEIAGESFQGKTVLAQQDKYVTFNVTAFGSEMVVVGYFDSYYKELTLNINVKEPSGVNSFGWGFISDTGEGGIKSGEFSVMDLDQNKIYKGTIKLVPGN